MVDRFFCAPPRMPLGTGASAAATAPPERLLSAAATETAAKRGDRRWKGEVERRRARARTGVASAYFSFREGAWGAGLASAYFSFREEAWGAGRRGWGGRRSCGVAEE